jgi:hypothetical protein
LGDSVHDPYRVGMHYGPLDIVRMIYDIQEYSGYQTPYDSKSIYTGEVNQGYEVNSEIINVIVPEGLRGIAF